MITTKFRFGVELECFLPKDQASDFMKAISATGVEQGADGSITPPPYNLGIELKTPPASLADTVSLLTQIESISKTFNASVNETCGLHVHTSHVDFVDNRTLRKILGLWLAIEDVMFSTQPESRLNSRYCIRRLASYATTGFPTLPKEKKQLLAEIGQSNRYYALNFASLAKYGTIECRLHAGSLNAEKITNWIGLLKTFYNTAMYKYNTKEIAQLFSMPTSEQKIQAVWDFLKLDKKLREYFDSRISKFLFPRLAVQQTKAKEMVDFRLATAKDENQAKKLENKAYGIQNRFERKISKLRQKTETAATQLLMEADKKKKGIKAKKEQLLREFAGSEFKGSLNNFDRPWAEHVRTPRRTERTNERNERRVRPATPEFNNTFFDLPSRTLVSQYDSIVSGSTRIQQEMETRQEMTTRQQEIIDRTRERLGSLNSQSNQPTMDFRSYVPNPTDEEADL